MKKSVFFAIAYNTVVSLPVMATHVKLLADKSYSQQSAW